MTFWTAARVRRTLGIRGRGDQDFAGVQTDTRALQPGALFVALSGPHFDGHDFLETARDAGVAGVVVRTGTPALDGVATFHVDDTLQALGLLARERRRAVRGPVIAITGTNGKTATKEMIRTLLAGTWRVHGTRENRNNLVGVPLTILEAPEATDALVVEAGANEPGEIGKLRVIIEPTIGVITNVSIGHVEGFRSLAATLDEKVTLVHDVDLAIVGTEPVELATRARRHAHRVLVAGTASTASVRPDHAALGSGGLGVLEFGDHRFHLPVPGRHQLENAMLALAVARELGVSLADVAERLPDVTLPKGRFEVVRHREGVVINDAYNANPASLSASLATADSMRGDRPLVVVLGSMLELGDDSAGLHTEMAARVMEFEPAIVAVTGLFEDAFASYASELGERLIRAPDVPTLGRELAARLTGNELILLKASRGVRLEDALPFIMA